MIQRYRAFSRSICVSSLMRFRRICSVRSARRRTMLENATDKRAFVSWTGKSSMVGGATLLSSRLIVLGLPLPTEMISSQHYLHSMNSQGLGNTEQNLPRSTTIACGESSGRFARRAPGEVLFDTPDWWRCGSRSHLCL